MFILSIKRGSKLLLLGMAGVCLLLAAGSAYAQIGTGTILGNLTDTTGALVPGATVTATNVDTSYSRSGVTNSEGFYRFPAMPVGNYQVQATKGGFKTETLKGLVLTVGQEAVLNIVLTVGTRQETVEVSTQAALVETTNSSMGNLVSPQQVSDLPLNGRNFTDLTLLQPGITQSQMEAGGSNAGFQGLTYSSNGAPVRSNNVMIDGTSERTLQGLNASSSNGTTLGLDGVQEYNVVTSMFGAEYGTAMGSQTNIVSKSGTNDWHGDAFEYLRNSALDARNYFDYLYTIPKDLPGGGRSIAEFQRNQFGGSIGGPIQKGKTFFYLTYEGLWQNVGNPLYVGLTTTLPPDCFDPTTQQILPTNNPCAIFSGGVVSPATLPILNKFPYPNLPNGQYIYASMERDSESYGQIRFDHTFSSKDSFFGRYTIDNAARIQPGAFPQYWYNWPSRNQFVTLSESHVFSSSLLNNFRASLSRTNMTGGYQYAASVAPSPSLSFIPGQPIGDIIMPPVSTWGPPPNTDLALNQDVTSFADDIFWTKLKHALKFGALVNHYEDGLNLLSFPSGCTFTTVPFFMESYGLTGAWTTGNFAGDYVYDTLGLYAQDDYRVASRLTLNLGVRWEFPTVPTEKNGKDYEYHNILTDTYAQTTAGPMWQQNSLKNFSPRIGFAWNVWGNGKTSVHGGYGIYYDMGDYGGLFFQQLPGQLQPTADMWIHLMSPLAVPFDTTVNYDNTFLSQSAIDYHLKQPYIHQYNLEVQQELPKGMALSVAYVGSRGIHLYDLYDGSPVIPCNYPGTNPNASTPGCAGLTALPWNNGMNPVYNANMTYLALGPPNPLTTICNPWYGQSCRLNPNLAEVTMDQSRGDSYYNSLQVTVNKRVSRGLQFQGAYTWSRTLDTSQGEMIGGADGSDDPLNPWNTRFDRGPTVFDAKSNFRLNAMYTFPSLQGHGFASALLGGWKMGNILSIESGSPFSVTNSSGVSVSNAELDFLDGGCKMVNERVSYVTPQNLLWTQQNINPNAVLYDPKTVVTGTANQWFNPNMFTEPAPVMGTGGATGGVFGDVSRGKLYGPGMGDWDFSLIKETRLPHFGEAGGLEFRAEFFNLVNRANFAFPSPMALETSANAAFTPGANPGQVAVNPVAGLVANTSTNSRQIQFALKIDF